MNTLIHVPALVGGAFPFSVVIPLGLLLTAAALAHVASEHFVERMFDKWRRR